MAYELYALIHPITNEVRYIGKSVNSKKRLIRHIHDSLKNKNDYPVGRWIRKLDQEGLRPIMTVYESYDTMEELNVAEVEHIAALKEANIVLLNVHTGGSGGFTSEMTKKANETLGVEGRKERVRRSRETMGAARMSEKSRKAIQTIGTEGLIARSRKAMKTLGTEGLSARALKTAQTLGTEGRKARAKKAVETKILRGLIKPKIQKIKKERKKPVGIYFQKIRNKWKAYSNGGLNKVYIGIFMTFEEACKAQENYISNRKSDEMVWFNHTIS